MFRHTLTLNSAGTLEWENRGTIHRNHAEQKGVMMHVREKQFSSSSRSVKALIVCAALLGGCRQPSAEAPQARDGSEEATNATPTGELYERIDSPTLLMNLEKAGFHFGAVLPGTNGVAINNKELSDRSPVYKTILNHINQDVAARKAKDSSLGVNTSHRTIDQRMLTSPEATFELTGVLNRMDAHIQVKEVCTVVRFAYRLAYRHNHRGRMDASRMPMTLLADFSIPFTDAASCNGYLNRWRGSPTLESLLSKSGPLSGDVVTKARFTHLELNYQIQTWPSSVAQNMGAFGEYVFRIFTVGNGTATPKPLPNTIDVARIKGSDGLKQELKNFLNDNANGFALRLAFVPQKFLATSISAFTPNGLSRLSNRPFSQIYGPADFPGITAKTKHVASSEEFLVRLNDMTCSGCHSGRSVNGFHFLGEERPNSTHRRNQVFVGFSEYSRVAKAGRLNILKTRVAGGALDTVVLPISIKPPAAGAEYGSACALDAHSGPGQKYAGWKCKAGLKCMQTDEAQSEKHLGKCFPPTLGSSGDPCNLGVTTESAHAPNEKLVVTNRTNCGGISACSDMGGGFPGGMCRRDCSSLDPNKEACGPIASNGFNECLDDPNRTFVDCLNNNAAVNGRSRCDRNRPCRADYFCAKAENTDSYGACVPGYFFFQLGMDAHPVLASSGEGITLGLKPVAANQKVVTAADAVKATGLTLKAKPISGGGLAAGESCVMPAGSVLGIARKGDAVNGHFPVVVSAPSSKCPQMNGLVFVYKDHALFK